MSWMGYSGGNVAYIAQRIILSQVSFFYAKRSSWLNSQWRGKGAVENRDFPTRDYIRQTNASCSALVSGPSWQPIILYPTFGLGNKINLARQNSGFPLTTPNHSGGTLPQLLTDFFFIFCISCDRHTLLKLVECGPRHEWWSVACAATTLSLSPPDS